MSVFDVLNYDLETRSKLDLPDVGAARYARHKSTEIILFLWAMNDEDVQCWQPLREPIPARLDKALRDDATAKAGWNILGFDNVVVEHKLGVKIPIEMSIDGMILALLHNLPGKLESCARAVGSPELKDKSGKDHIRMFSKPLPANAVLRKSGHVFRDWNTDPEEWDGFIFYGCQDVRAARDTTNRIPRWNCTDFELQVLIVNCAINERGVPLDIEFVENVIDYMAHAKERLLQTATEISGGIKPSQRAKAKEWLQSQGVWLSDMRKDTVDNYLERKDVPDNVRTFLAAGRELTSTSTAKYPVLRDNMCDDGTCKWMIQYAGAHTLRFSGKGPQPHNFPRGTVDHRLVELFTKGLAETMRVPKGDVFAMASSSLRGAFKAPQGWMFSQSDLSAIEGRGTAWVAGEQWVLDQYNNGADMYVMDYAMCFGMDYDELFARYKSGDKEAKNMRQQGKPINLAFGYAGGVNAFVAMARNYRIDLVAMARELYRQNLLTEKDKASAKRLFHMPKFRHNIVTSGFADDMDTWVALDCVKRAWRRAHWRTAAFWRELDYAIRCAIDNPGTIYLCGVNDCLVIEVVDFQGNDWLRIGLPSGRYLSYKWPKISGRKKQPVFTGGVNEDGSLEVEDEDDEDTVISFFTPHASGYMVKKYMHAGVFTENIVQAFCRDVLCEGMIRAEQHPLLTPVLHVHDEIVCLTRTNQVRLLTDLMTQPVEWAPGLPLDGEGWFGPRYCKD